MIEPVLASTTANSIENTSRIGRLELDAGFEEPSQLEFDNSLTSGVDQLRDELGTRSNNFMNMVQAAGYQGGNARNLSSLIRRSNYDLAQAFFTNFFAAIGGLSFVVGISYQIYDRWRDSKLYDEEKNLILTYEKIKNETDASVANLIHKNGLIITQSTNNNFTNAGTYEVNTSNNCVLIIIIQFLQSFYYFNCINKFEYYRQHGASDKPDEKHHLTDVLTNNEKLGSSIQQRE